MIHPFVLRRLKSDPAIAAELPEKVEQVHVCDLAESQAALYRAVVEAELAQLTEQAVDGHNAHEGIDNLGADDNEDQEETQEAAKTRVEDATGSGERSSSAKAFSRQGKAFAMLHALRRVCNHPANLPNKRRPKGFENEAPARCCVEASGKCLALHHLLEKILAGGEKVVICCNYLETIDMLKEQIEAAFKCAPLKFVGSMDRGARDAVVQAFQENSESLVLLLSLQAGGMGINLTAATHVIHFDRCYNPAKENQATDRLHRIGQTRTVFVHRLLTRDTFEERMAEIMRTKQCLSDLTMRAGEAWIADLDQAALRDLFSLGPCAGASAAPAQAKKRRKV